jgi:uncharacterized hydrophobic protein (TIGR00271 family)
MDVAARDGALDGEQVERRPQPKWWRRARIDPEERRRILTALYPEPGDGGHWAFRFAVMLGLSVVIAELGLSGNSAAVVIGAMLIAPLMTPVLGVSAALVMAWPKHLVYSLLAMLGGVAGSVGISWALTSLLPAADRVLTPEVLSRTSPDLRDLLVALAAGAAGAYATVREDVSAALPGVAVAVALVPPLAATGYCLSIGRGKLAGGAFLLFAANLVAIVLASAFVMLSSGFVPLGRRHAVSLPIRIGLVATTVATAAVAVPLAATSIRNDATAQRNQAVNQAVASWLTAYPNLKLTNVNVSGADVTVDVVGPTTPPPSATLVVALSSLLGPNAAVRVDWYQSTAATSKTTTASPSLTLAELRPLVHSWLAKSSVGARAFRLLDLSMSGDVVSVDLEGASAPPAADLLAKAVSAREGSTVTVSVSWRMQSFLTAQAGATTPAAAGTEIARSTFETWSQSHPGVDLLGLSLAGGVATIDLAGGGRSLVTADLRRALASALGPDVQVVIRFVRLRTLSG